MKENKEEEEKDGCYLCVASRAVLFEMTWSDVQVVITLKTLPLSYSLTDAALPQSWKEKLNFILL